MQLDGGVRGIRVKNRTAPTRLRFIFPFESQCRSLKTCRFNFLHNRKENVRITQFFLCSEYMNAFWNNRKIFGCMITSSMELLIPHICTSRYRTGCSISGGCSKCEMEGVGHLAEELTMRRRRKGRRPRATSNCILPRVFVRSE